jgi:hypothetical protein
MKTDKNSRTTTTEGTQPKPELTVPDNSPQGKPGKYWVHLYWIHTDEAIHKITAKSLAQAEAMAYKIGSSRSRVGEFLFLKLVSAFVYGLEMVFDVGKNRLRWADA